MPKHDLHRCVAAPGCLAAFLTLVPSLHAHSDSWRWAITPYVWATDVGVDVELDGRGVVDETIPVEDLLEDIDRTFQGRITARHDEHGFLVDLFHVSMSDEVESLALPQGAGSGDLDWRLDMTIADVAATYDPAADGEGVSFLYGVRVIDQQAAVDADFTTASGPTTEHYDGGETLFDALAGVRLDLPIGDRLRFESQWDVSTGGTDFTWSVSPALEFSSADGSWGLVAGYRHMQIDFEDHGGLESELSLSGPLLGVRFSF